MCALIFFRLELFSRMTLIQSLPINLTSTSTSTTAPHPSLIPLFLLLHSHMPTLICQLLYANSGTWDGKGIAPALSSCSQTEHLNYDAVREHQKVMSGSLIFTYGVQWKQSETLWVRTSSGYQSIQCFNHESNFAR